MTRPYAIAVTAVCAAVLCGCGARGSKDSSGADTLRPLPDTLRVVTLYSPTSYFMYREEPMGYDYALVNDFAADKGLAIKLEVAPSLERAMQLLEADSADLLAYEVPVTADYRHRVAYCGPTGITKQVLVQPRSSAPITDVTGLVGKDIYVERNSKYEQRIRNLNDELGGGIKIHTVARDTLITEDLLALVATGEIPLTVVDSDVARLNATYYPGLDITLPVSFAQKAQWAVPAGRAWLADSINAWFGGELPQRIVSREYKRYFEVAKTMPAAPEYDLSHGRVSPYDALFKKYAAEIGWDWRLLASVGYVESRFDSSVVSWAGARGIMQIMPGTARANGSSPEAMVNPETSIRVAAKLLGVLDKSMATRVKDPEQRRLFVLAAYNAGAAHIYDAIALARITGRNPEVWRGNTENALLLKADPEYYNAPAVKYGYFRGRQTVEYVRQVQAFYDRVKKQIKR